MNQTQNNVSENHNVFVRILLIMGPKEHVGMQQLTGYRHKGSVYMLRLHFLLDDWNPNINYDSDNNHLLWNVLTVCQQLHWVLQMFSQIILTTTLAVHAVTLKHRHSILSP